jgi:hypothetical protein
MRGPLDPSWLLVILASIPLLLDLTASTRSLPVPPSLPDAGEGFVGRDIPLTKAETVLLGRVPATKKLYTIAGHLVTVVRFDATVDRHVVHDPTYCLKGKDWRILRDEERAVPAGRVRLIKAERSHGQTRRLVLFYQTEERWYTSEWTYLLDFLRARWWPGRSSSLCRVIVQASGHDITDEAWLVDVALPRLFGRNGG